MWIGRKTSVYVAQERRLYVNGRQYSDQKNLRFQKIISGYVWIRPL